MTSRRPAPPSEPTTTSMSAQSAPSAPSAPSSPPTSLLPVGRWQVDATRSAASFAARIAGRRVRGSLPLTGHAVVTPSLERSTAELVASAESVRTGLELMDRLLAGPGFLHAASFPDIGFRSDLLVRVPTGWRAVGRLQVKGVEHQLACEVEVEPRRPDDVLSPARFTTTWALDSSWITHQRVPGLGRLVVMTCDVVLRRTSRPPRPRRSIPRAARPAAG